MTEWLWLVAAGVALAFYVALAVHAGGWKW